MDRQALKRAEARRFGHDRMFFLHFDHPINSDLNDLNLTYQKWWVWMLCTVYIKEARASQ